MKKNIIHTALFRILVPIPFGALVYLLLLMINNNLLIIDESFISAELLFCIGLTYITLESNRLSLITVFKKDSLSFKQSLVQLVINMVLTLLLIYLSLMVYFIAFLGYSSLAGFSTEVKSFSIFFGITSLLYNMLAISYKLLTKRNEQLFEDEETLKEQIQFELEDYQTEVNPNLLFESLESAITLIHRDIDDAEEFIDHLALVYRYMLSNKNNDFITLKKEIAAAENLIYLHNVRHSEGIKLMAKAVNDDNLIIPGSVPMIIEEIIRSSIIADERPLEIALEMEEGYLTIAHKLNKRLTRNNHEIITLKKLQTAYSFHTSQPLIKVEAYGEAFYKIPIINLNASAA